MFSELVIPQSGEVASPQSRRRFRDEPCAGQPSLRTYEKLSASRRL
jgi:hypothetical protein